MIAYAVPGGLMKRIVLVKFTNHQLSSLLQYQKILQSKYMKVLYQKGEDIEIQLQSIGNNYDNVYAYAQEHHTLELYMQLWKRFNDNVIAN